MLRGGFDHSSVHCLECCHKWAGSILLFSPLIQTHPCYLTLNPSPSFIHFKRFLGINSLALEGGGNHHHLFHVEALQAMHICVERATEETRDNTNVAIFRQLKGKGIIILIKPARIHWNSPFPALDLLATASYLRRYGTYSSLSQGVSAVALNSLAIHEGTIYLLSSPWGNILSEG